MPVVLASDIMDASAVLLNDASLSLFTYTTQLPYLKRANQVLEQILIGYGLDVQRQQSAPISVGVGALVVTLPADFLLPIKLFERAGGNVNDPWTLMSEGDWNPESVTQLTTLRYWAFYNNAINLVGATVARDVLLEYDRMLAVTSGSSSPQDNYLMSAFLSSKTAEFCARYIGLNETMANAIRDNEVLAAEDMLVRIYVLEDQGTRQRRPRFSAQRNQIGQ